MSIISDFADVDITSYRRGHLGEDKIIKVRKKVAYNSPGTDNEQGKDIGPILIIFGVDYSEVNPVTEISRGFIGR